MERLKAKGEQAREEYLANREKLEEDKYSEPGRPGVPSQHLVLLGGGVKTELKRGVPAHRS